MKAMSVGFMQFFDDWRSGSHWRCAGLVGGDIGHILSQYDEIAYATWLFANGARGRGYLLKDYVDNAEALREALKRVCAGESVIDSAPVGRLLSHQRHLSKLDLLTNGEQDILAHLAEGRSNLAIHKITKLSEKTIESYITRICTKLDISGTPITIGESWQSSSLYLPRRTAPSSHERREFV